jgi:Right handed beta helix region/RTX calcium-binding nonapeptide repeat (4 copies)
MSGRRTLGAGLSLGALAALPATAQADDFKVTNLKNSGAGSLRTAIDDADDAGGPDRILFKSKLSGAIQLKGPPLEVQGGDVRIVGPGARRVTVSAPSAERAFEVRGSSAPPVPYADMDVTISGLTLTGGDARDTDDEDGGAIFAIGEVDLTISRVTISGNTAVDGGGVAMKPYGTDAELVVEDSTISGNSATATGGGIYGQGADTRVSNSTISGNEAGNVGGGAAVLHSSSDIGPSFEVRNSTVTGNVAESGGGLAASVSLYFLPYFSGFALVGSIVAGNTAATNPDLDDLEFSAWNVSFSLIGEVGTADFDDEGGNLIGVDPKLKPLKNNGGPTNTHAFKKSPAKNKVPKSESEKKDQRGAPRKGKGDIGAYELVKCEGVIVNRVGTGKKDKLKGTKKKDGILGLGGNDKLFGRKGKDGLCGGKGKDTLKGGPGKDRLDGGPGKDKEIQ